MKIEDLVTHYYHYDYFASQTKMEKYCSLKNLNQNMGLNSMVPIN